MESREKMVFGTPKTENTDEIVYFSPVISVVVRDSPFTAREKTSYDLLITKYPQRASLINRHVDSSGPPVYKSWENESKLST